MTIRSFALSDYDEVKRWWDHYNYEVIHPDWFPPNTFVCEEDEKLLGIFFVYMMDVPMVFTDHLTVSPEVTSPMKIHRVITSLIEYSICVAKSNGKTVALGYTKRSGLKKFYRKRGYRVTQDQFSIVCGRL